MKGVIVLDKPVGLRSTAAVGAIKKLLPAKVKVGHAGTLDSFATGVLLVLVGAATKSCESLMDQPKTYQATIKLGATTVTDDPTSEEVPFPEEAHGSSRGLSSRENVQSALARFIGAIQQRPPNFSAVKIAGRRASDRTRAGQKIDLQPRTVQIYSIDLLAYDWPLLSVRIDCGRGTYIRSIARDLGEMLQVGGYLTQLRRTRIGEFRIEHSTPLDQLDRENILAKLRAI